MSMCKLGMWGFGALVCVSTSIADAEEPSPSVCSKEVIVHQSNVHELWSASMPKGAGEAGGPVVFRKKGAEGLFKGTGTDEGYVFALNSNGKVRVIYKKNNSHAGGWGPPAVRADGSFVIGLDKTVCFFNARGELQKTVKMTNTAIVAPSFLSNGSVVTTDYNGNVYFLDAQGNKKAAFKTGGRIEHPPLVQADGTVVVSSADGGLYFLNSDGTLKKKISFNSGVSTAPVALPDGTIVYAPFGDFLRFLSPDGNEKNKISVEEVAAPPVITKDGTVVVSDIYGKVTFLSQDGNRKATFNSGSNHSFVVALPNGGVAVNNDDGRMFFLNSDGTEKARYQLKSRPAYLGMNVKDDGTLLVTSRDGIHALRLSDAKKNVVQLVEVACPDMKNASGIASGYKMPAPSTVDTTDSGIINTRGNGKAIIGN